MPRLRRLRPPRPAPSHLPTPAALEPSPAPERRVGQAEIVRGFDASRRALQCDYIDLYLMHEMTPRELAPDALDHLRRLRADGLVKQIGLAAHGARYLDLTPEELADWDVLQYEFGPDWPSHVGLRAKAPKHTHIFHSCLRGLKEGAHGPVSASDVLAARLADNPAGKVLFSSRQVSHLRANLRRFAS